MRALAAALAAFALAAPAAHGHDPAAPPVEDAARGLHYDGLTPARPDGPCRGAGYEIAVGLTISCTHGPDPAAEGEDVRKMPSLAELRESTEAARPVPCIGDGISGPRVQAVYAYQIGQPNRIDSVRPLIQGWAADANDIVRASAAHRGGTRDIRYVTGPSCLVDVLAVGVDPAAAGDNFRVTINDLVNRGLSRPDRKYLVWMDASVLCGIAQSYEDDSPGQTNMNNGRAPFGLFARVDRGCWGDMRGPSQSHVETHELVHTLGAVLETAPNRSAAGHCTDDFDVMCYDDDQNPSTFPLRIVCGSSAFERRLDCNGDDYFNVAPVAGSWLSRNWNTANSAFLERGESVQVPPAPSGLRVVAAGVSQLVVEWDPVPGAAGYELYVDGIHWRGGAETRADVGGLLCGKTFTIGVETLGAGGLLSNRAALTASTAACPDRQPPVVTPRPASGARGKLVRLRYTVVDEGETREVVTVLRGGTRLRSFTTRFGRGATGRSVAWRVPARARGPLRFCVRATDRNGNTSSSRCARIRL